MTFPQIEEIEPGKYLPGFFIVENLTRRTQDRFPPLGRIQAIFTVTL